MESNQDSAALAQQVRNLAATVEELTRQNQEMRQRLQQEENRSRAVQEDEGDSHGRSDRQRTITPEEQHSDILQEMRKEMDELRNAIKEKTDRSLDKMLSSAFLRHFVGGQRPKRPADHLLTIKQRERETLRSYVKRFTRETLEVDDADDKVQLTTFKAGLKSREFVVSLAKNPPRTMAEMLLKAQKYMNAEDALAAIVDEGKLRTEGRKEDERREQKRERPSRRGDPGSTPPEVAEAPALVTKCARQKQILQIPQGPRPLHRRLPRCERTDRRIDTKGKLQKYVRKGDSNRFREGNTSQREPSSKNEGRQSQPQEVIGEISTIAGGPFVGGSCKSLKKAYQRQVNSVHTGPPLKQRRTNQDIFFSEEDARGVRQPHNDPLVIALTIEGFNTKRILVDNGSSADIMYLSAFQQLKLGPSRLRPFESPLVSFSGDRVYPKGIVTLKVTIGAYPKQQTRHLDFLVVDCPSSYNVIIGRPTLN
ncbi:uncharacterized protein LOC142639846 [Castanea sativa]|uniref:uncharacterized protein LOC142639846 n=1 Tax=Castanea sativa TaxID=21020 RepID=UPI003F64B638